MRFKPILFLTLSETMLRNTMNLGVDYFYKFTMDTTENGMIIFNIPQINFFYASN